VIGASRFAAKPLEPANAAAAATQVSAAAAVAPALPTAFFRDIAVKAALPVAPVASMAPATRVAEAHGATMPTPITLVPPAAAVTPIVDVATPAATNGYTIPLSTAFAPESETPAKSQGPMFQTLFHAGERGAVAPVVRELWGARRAAADPATAPSDPSAGARLNAPLDLFNFLRPAARRPA
jgi:hypothetical protein